MSSLPPIAERPPRGHQTPTLRHELSFAVGFRDSVDGGGRGDNAPACFAPAGPCESVQRDDFFPGQLIGGAPAHARQDIALLDVLATLGPNSATCANTGHDQPWASYIERLLGCGCGVSVVSTTPRLLAPSRSSDGGRTPCSAAIFVVIRSPSRAMASIWPQLPMTRPPSTLTAWPVM